MFKQKAPVLSGDSQHQSREAMQRAILTLLLGLFLLACFSTSVPLTAGRLDAGTDVSMAVSLGHVEGRVYPPNAAVRRTDSSVPESHVDYPVLDAKRVAQDKNTPEVRQLASRIERPTVTLLITGDVMLGRQVGIEMVKRNDFLWPFHRTTDLLAGADLTLANLETPIVTGCPFSSEGMVFCADPRVAEGLAQAGIDGVSLANNHAYTYGEAGFDETLSYLRQAGVEPIPAGTLVVNTVDGLQIGILSFNDSDALLDVNWATAVVKESSHQVDVLIGLIHWGVEYQAEPTDRQREVGHALIDAGMDVIIGAHPHRVQPVEEYGGKLIVYSLGNFVFDQMWWDETRLGGVVRLKMVKTVDGVTVSYELIRVKIFDYSQPIVME